MVASSSWQDEALSLRVRVALWLRDVVGEGGTFERAALETALGNAGLRRLGELRQAGWVIVNSRVGSDIPAGHARLVAIGRQVWND